jgi:hypothetical protein
VATKIFIFVHHHHQMQTRNILAAFVLVLLQYAQASEVVVLGDATLESTINSNKFVLVEFCARVL